MKVLYVGFFSRRGAMMDDYVCMGNHLAKRMELYCLTGTAETGISITGCREHLQLPFSRQDRGSYLSPANYRRMAAFIRKSGIELVFFKTPSPLNVAVALMCGKLPQVYYIHDYQPHSGMKPLVRGIYAASDRILKRFCSCGVVASERLKQLLMEYDPSWRRLPVEVIPLGLLDNLVFRLPEVAQDIDVLFFGRIEHYKGIDWFLEVAGRRLPRLHICVIGKGAMDPELDALCSGNPNIRFCRGYMEDRELAEHINRSKVVILPYRSGTGTQVIQTAFYYRKCVIATDVGNFAELIENGRDGMIVPPEDEEAMVQAVSRAVRDGSFRRFLGENAYRKVLLEFDNDRVAEKYRMLFERLL